MNDVRCWGQSGKTLLLGSIRPLTPNRTSAEGEALARLALAALSVGCKPPPGNRPAGSNRAVMEVTKWLKLRLARHEIVAAEWQAATPSPRLSRAPAQGYRGPERVHFTNFQVGTSIFPREHGHLLMETKAVLTVACGGDTRLGSAGPQPVRKAMSCAGSFALAMVVGAAGVID